MANTEKEELITTWVPKEEVFFSKILLLLWFFSFLNLENEDAGLDF